MPFVPMKQGSNLLVHAAGQRGTKIHREPVFQPYLSNAHPPPHPSHQNQRVNVRWLFCPVGAFTFPSRAATVHRQAGQSWAKLQ